jgi:hypothetical protein
MRHAQMKLPQRIALAVVSLLMICNSGLAGGGWTQKPQSLYAKLGFNWLSSDRFFTIAGNELKTSLFYLRTLDLYVEYGLIDRLTAQLSFPLLRSANFENTEAATGIGDLSLELKYGLFQNDFPVAIALGVDIPTGDSKAIGLLKNDNFGGFIRLPTGDGEWNIWTKVYLSHSFHPIPAYFTIDGGFNFRTQGFTNQYALGVEVGYKFFDALWMTARVRRLALVNTPNSALSGAIGLGEGVEFNSVGLGLSYSLTQNFSVTADVIGGFGVLKNIYSSPGFNIGVAVEL